MPSMSAPLYKVPLKPGAAKAGKASTVYQLRIELRGVKPKVWRRIVVSGSLTLAKLHRVIQAAMGWSDSHLHEFVIDRQRYGQSDPEWDAPGEAAQLLPPCPSQEVQTLTQDLLIAPQQSAIAA